MFKKVFFILAVFFVGIFGLYSLSSAQNFDSEEFYYDIPNVNNGNDNLDFGKIVKKDAVEDKGGAFYKIKENFGLTKNIYETETPALDYIKMIVNIILGLATFIGLVYLIYGFYMIFFSKDDSGVQKAKKILKGVVVAFVFIAVSYLITSFLFYLYRVFTNTSSGNNVSYIVKNLDKIG